MAEKTLEYSPGLEGVVAGETTISYVNPARNSLMYRGYDIRDLVEKTSYEEVAYLLLYGKLPNKAELEAFDKTLKQERTIPDSVANAIKAFPKGRHPMDYLRAATDLLSLTDAEVSDGSHDANVRKAVRLVAKFPTMVAHAFRTQNGEAPVAPDNSLNHAENFLYMLFNKKPDAYFAKVLDATLICYADHGFNASTFASRVTTSTLSDLHSGIVSAIGTLKGPLHGGANEEAMHMLLEIGSPEKADAWVIDALATKKKIMGFGHREYKTGDPRAFILNDMGAEMGKKLGDTRWSDTAAIVAAAMDREKQIQPNVDFPTAYIYYMMGLPIEIYTPLFAIARVAGWSAHIIEQLDNNRLIRPKAIYNGPDHLEVTPIEKR